MVTLTFFVIITPICLFLLSFLLFLVEETEEPEGTDEPEGTEEPETEEPEGTEEPEETEEPEGTDEPEETEGPEDYSFDFWNSEKKKKNK